MFTRYQALQDERAQRETEAAAILDGVRAAGRTDMTADEAARFDAAANRLDTIKVELDREEKARAFARNQPAAAAPVDTARITGGHDRAVDRPWGADTGAKFGEFLLAVHRAHTGRGVDPRLMKPAADDISAATATVGVGADGGFLVSRDMAAELGSFLQTGELYSRVRRIPISGGANGLTIAALDETNLGDGYAYGGVTAYWTAEAGSISASSATFRQIDLKLNKIAALYYASDEILEDAPALQSLAFTSMQQAILWKAENAFIRGIGGATPVGILNGAATVAVAAETGQAAGTLLFENLLKMWKRMPAAMRGNAVWLINQDVELELWRMSLPIGTAGVPVFLPPSGASGAPYSTLFGRPIVPIPYCSTLGTVGDVILADLSKYVVIEKAGPQMASSFHFAFDTGKQAFRVTHRIDGQPWLYSAITPAQGTDTQSAFLTVATR